MLMKKMNHIMKFKKQNQNTTTTTKLYPTKWDRQRRSTFAIILYLWSCFYPNVNLKIFLNTSSYSISRSSHFPSCLTSLHLIYKKLMGLKLWSLGNDRCPLSHNSGSLNPYFLRRLTLVCWLWIPLIETCLFPHFPQRGERGR